MRQRTISSIGVVVVGLIPALCGGPLFALAFGLLCLIGYGEWSRITRMLGGVPSLLGYPVIAGFGLAALAGGREDAVLGLTAAAIGLPLVEAALLRPRLTPDGSRDWSLSATGTLYLGVPLFAAVALRGTDGSVEAGWLGDLAGWVSPGWNDAPRGLGLLLTVILVTWLNDTGAYLVGRSFGRHRLAPAVSPNKTIEGACGGVAAAILTAVVAEVVFGLGLSLLGAALFGLGLAVVGQVGDLAESLVKRQAGVKDSGTLIPGHGGVLDRIDAMLFALTAGWLLVPLLDRIA